MNYPKKNICILVCILLLSSCQTTKTKNIPGNFKAKIFVRARHEIQGIKFTPIKNYASPVVKKYQTESAAKETHDYTPRYFLEEFLSVNKMDWYRKMFSEGKVFSKISTETFTRRNMEEEESFEILKSFGIVYDSISYKMLKIKHLSFDGKEDIIEMILVYDNKTKRYYLIEKASNPNLQEMIDIFFAVKQSIGIALTKVDYKRNFPPSGDKTLDKQIHEIIYDNFGLGNSFNVSRFILITNKWKEEGEVGLSNYFFEK